MKLKTHFYLMIIWMVCLHLQSDYIPKDNLDGHWHSNFWIYDDTSGRYSTFDIYQDTGIVNDIGSNYADEIFIQIDKRRREIRHNAECIGFAKGYFFENDHLILYEQHDRNRKENYTKDRIAYRVHNCSKQKDFFSYQKVNIDLSIIQDKSFILDDLSLFGDNYYAEELYLGTIKNGASDLSFLQLGNKVYNYSDTTYNSHTSYIGNLLRDKNSHFSDYHLGIKLYVNKKTPVIYLLKVVDALVKAGFDEGFYLANRYDTDLKKEFKIGWLPLTGKLPKAGKMTYEEWLKVYYQQLEEENYQLPVFE